MKLQTAKKKIQKRIDELEQEYMREVPGSPDHVGPATAADELKKILEILKKVES